MMNVSYVITSFTVMWKEDTFILIRIEFLAALVTLMFLAMFVMDIYRFQLRSSTITTIMEIIDRLSHHIVVYLMGAMNSTDFDNPLFLVWGIVLMSLHESLHYLSAHNIMDPDELFVQAITLASSSVFCAMNGLEVLYNPILWHVYILQLRRMCRAFARQMALRSLWHGQSSEFLPNYLCKGAGNQHSGSNNNNSNNTQKYLVYGESNMKTNIKRPQYILQLDDTDHESLITIEKIWECSGPLLNSGNSCRYKDMSLAFALWRLLRCRLEGVPLHSESIPMTRNLITLEVIGCKHAGADVEVEQAAGRAFRILELETAFVRDYFYTIYPMVFSRGFLSLSFILLQSIATIAVDFWLGVTVICEDDSVSTVHVFATCAILFCFMFKEVWEMVTYLLSNWTRLLLVCKYVQSQCWFQGSATLTENLTRSFFSSKIVNPWHGQIGQYQFLQSCTYKPTFWKLAHTITLGVTPKKDDGKKSGNVIKMPECVKAAVLQELRLLDLGKLTGHRLPIHLLMSKVTGSLPRDSVSRFEKYEWVFHLHTCSEVILVWHIATSLCEVKLALDNHIELSNPGFLHSLWSRLKKLGRCSSQPFLLDENILLQGRLQTNYRIANSLSRYCAYLQAFQPELLPDMFMVPKMVFKKALQNAYEELKDCDSMVRRYDKMKAIAQETGQDSEYEKLSKNIVEQGSILANDLIEKEGEENRWEILAGVWVGLVVHIAPSWNAGAHKDKLKSGGELITLICALLWHCGIEKSNLWHEDNADESNAQLPQEDSTETRNT